MTEGSAGIVMAFLPLKLAQDEKRCRICGRSYEQDSPFGSRVPFQLDYGEEFAHAACLDRYPSRKWLAKKRCPRLEWALSIVRSRIAYRGTNSRGPYRDPVTLQGLHAREARLVRLIGLCVTRGRPKDPTR